MPNHLIKSASDLITSREETRSSFIAMALEKNYIAVPYVEEAKALKTLANSVTEPMQLLDIEGLRGSLLTSSGLSAKALNYLTEDDKTLAIRGLIEEFLEPAGEDFADELVYRYLLTKGDALGGKARNLAGSLGERKFIRSILSVINVLDINYRWKDSMANTWLNKPKNDEGIEKRVKAISWSNNGVDRVLVLNIKVPLVNKNVDLNILEGTPEELESRAQSLTRQSEKYLALGELKGGVDPAGADEHWKTANSALNRIKSGFLTKKLSPKTFFVGAAIESAMANEIFKQLQEGKMDSAANLTHDEQLIAVCNWIVNL